MAFLNQNSLSEVYYTGLNKKIVQQTNGHREVGKDSILIIGDSRLKDIFPLLVDRINQHFTLMYSMGMSTDEARFVTQNKLYEEVYEKIIVCTGICDITTKTRGQPETTYDEIPEHLALFVQFQFANLKMKVRKSFPERKLTFLMAGIYGLDLTTFSNKHKPNKPAYIRSPSQDNLDLAIKITNAKIHKINLQETSTKLRIDGIIHRSHGKQVSYKLLYDGCHPDGEFLVHIAEYFKNMVDSFNK